MFLGRIIYIFFSIFSLSLTVSFLYMPNLVLLFVISCVGAVSTLLRIGSGAKTESFVACLVADCHYMFAFVAMVGDYLSDKAIYAAVLGGCVSNLIAIVMLLLENKESNHSYQDEF